MLAKGKQRKLRASLKTYHKKFLAHQPTELDESGTRLMINYFLTDVLGYAPIDEVKTEYMIRGTYADYVLQLKGKRHFLVEVKALSLALSEKHLRQAINYGANEGIDWALLTNGRQFNAYKIIFGRPIESRLVFSLDLGSLHDLKNSAEALQFLHKDSVKARGLDHLWNKTVALDPKNVAGILYTEPVLRFIRKILKRKYKHKFEDIDIEQSLDRILVEPIQPDEIRQTRIRKAKKGKANGPQPKVSREEPAAAPVTGSGPVAGMTP